MGEVPLHSQKSRITWDLEYPVLVHKELLCPHSVLPSVANTICVARAKSQHSPSTAQEEPPAQGLLSGLDFIFWMAQFGLQGPKVSRILHRCRCFFAAPIPGEAWGCGTLWCSGSDRSACSVCSGVPLPAPGCSGTQGGVCQDPGSFGERETIRLISFLNSTIWSLEASISGSHRIQVLNPGSAHASRYVVGGIFFFGAVRNSYSCLGFGWHNVRSRDQERAGSS